MRRLSIILTLLFVSAQIGVAQKPVDLMRRQAARQFMEKHGDNWEIQWQEKMDTPAALLGGKVRGYGGPSLQAGLTFLQDHKKLFGIEDAREQLQFDRKNGSDDGSVRVVYQQTYQGVPVLFSGYLVAINEAGAVYYVSGDYYSELKVPTVTPSLQPQDVTSLIRQDLKAFSPADSFKTLRAPKLSIYVDQEGDSLTYHLAYKAKAERRHPLKAFLYVVDANSGEVLYKTSLLEDITGSGSVYNTNPDNGNPVTRTLHRLDGSYSPLRLIGSNVAVYDYYGNHATSSSGTFNYSPSNLRFDQVMAYYHSDEFEAWLMNSLGMPGSQVNQQVQIFTRYFEGYAFSRPALGEIYFTDGSGYSGRKNPTHEAAIIVHEYMHVVSQTYNSLIQNDMALAMDEAYSDYFGIAYRYDVGEVSSTVIGEYIDGSGGLDYTRNVDNTHTMSEYNTIDLEPDGETEEHDRSVILSGALWDFTTDVPNRISGAANYVLGSLRHLDNNPSFLEARNALIHAVRNQGHPEYKCGIQREFAAHGIGSVCNPTNLQVTNRDAYDPDHPVQLAWDPVSGANEYHVYRCRASGFASPCYTSYTHILTTSSTSATDTQLYVDDGSSGDGTAKYYVTAFVSGMESEPSNVVEVYVKDPSNKVAKDAAELTVSEALPETFALEGNYPNPFNPSTEIRFALPKAAHVTLTVYDALGRQVAELVNRSMEAGYHSVRFDAGSLPSGTYLYRLKAGSFVETRQMMLVK